MLKNTTAIVSIERYLTDKLNKGGLIYSELLKQMIWLLSNFVRKPDSEI